MCPQIAVVEPDEDLARLDSVAFVHRQTVDSSEDLRADGCPIGVNVSIVGAHILAGSDKPIVSQNGNSDNDDEKRNDDLEVPIQRNRFNGFVVISAVGVGSGWSMLGFGLVTLRPLVILTWRLFHVC